VTFLRKLGLGRALAAIAAAAAVTGSAKADITLDDFAAPTPAINYAITSSNANPYTTPIATTSAGQTRVVSVNVISGLGAFSATGQVGGGIFELSTPAASTARANVGYSWGSGVNLTALNATGITLSFTFADLSVPYSIRITDSESNSAFATGTITGAGSYTVSTSAFAGVNLSSVSTVELLLNQNLTTNSSTTSADFILDTVTLNTQTPDPQPDPIPAPPAAFLALAAIPALGLRKFFKKA
jgi:hypothetical protein